MTIRKSLSANEINTYIALPTLLFFVSQLRAEDGTFKTRREASRSNGRTPRWYNQLVECCSELPPSFASGPDLVHQIPDPLLTLPVPRADYDEPTVWTDGSLEGPCGSCSVFSNSYQASYKIPPVIGLSSTTTELAGLLSAIYHHDPRTPLVIHTDSQAAIFLERRSNPTARTRLKNSNNDLVEAPQVLASNHAAPISINWVKGHSGDAGNDAADRLATAARRDACPPKALHQHPVPVTDWQSMSTQDTS